MNRQYRGADPAGFGAYETRLHAEEEAKAYAKAQPCYVAEVMPDGKLQCPLCKKVEGGTSRIITHVYNCQNNTKPYCRDNKGGRRRSRKGRKGRRTKRRRNSRKK